MTVSSGPMMGPQKYSAIEEGRSKLIAPRVIKTSNIDLFLQCDDMTLEELLIATENEDQKDFRNTKSLPKTAEEYRNEEPEWGSTPIEEIKRGDDALRRAA